jgi:small-conductance mechanosensitive channel
MQAWLAETLNISERVAGQILWTALLVIGVLVVRWLVLRQVRDRVDDPELAFRARKTVVYGATIIIVVAIGRIWANVFDDLGTFLGLLSAGIAIALADVFLNLAGWAYIVTRRPFKTGDRIEVGTHAGDVVDIRVFRFTMLEIRNWVDADQSTGRLIHVPNGVLFRQTMANFTEGFAHIWHEIPVLITFESDWKMAERLIREQLEPYHMGEEEMHAAEEFQAASREYFIRFKELDPIVYVDVKDSGVLLTARLLVHPRQRRGVHDSIWRGILEAFNAEPSVELAYPTIRTFRGPEFE